MTTEVWLVLGTLVAAIALFTTEWLRYDVVALLVLFGLVLLGLVTAPEALRGFGNPAVITVAAVLVLSGGLARTGVANRVGRHVLRLAGERLGPLTLATMVTAGVLSGIMNDIAVTALLLPVVVDIARRIGQPASRLLIPLAFASLLGGMTTLIGTAPNILISGILADSGQPAFRMFDFTPVGAVVLFAGILYLVLFGRRLLPEGPTDAEVAEDGADIRVTYDLGDTLFTLRIPEDSALSGRSLIESRLGLSLGLNVLAILRHDRTFRAPRSGFILRGGDLVIVEGRAASLEALRNWRQLGGTEHELTITQDLVSESVGLAELSLSGKGDFVGHTLSESRIRQRCLVHVMGIRRGSAVRHTHINRTELEEGDVLLVLGRTDQIDELASDPAFTSVRHMTADEVSSEYRLARWLMKLTVPEASTLDGSTLQETRLGEAFDLTVLEVRRDGETAMLPGPDTRLEAGDLLLIEGRRDDFAVMNALQRLEVRAEAPSVDRLESGDVGLTEVTLSPRAEVVGHSLEDLSFREKFGLSVLAIWRGGQSYHSNVRVRSMPLEFGDGLLVYGEKEKLEVLAAEPDFIVLGEESRAGYRENLAGVAAAIMAGVILTASLEIQPIYVAAPVGALLMVLTGCLTADEAYRTIEWKVIMLIGGMLGLGAAMQATGATSLIAESVLGVAGSLGPLAVIGSLFLITALAAQFIPTAAVAVLMAPIALSSAAELGLSSTALLMVVAVGASCAFMSPFGHAVNLLVMGVGGYRVTDYTKVGLPLVVIIFLIVLFVLPLFWPLTG